MNNDLITKTGNKFPVFNFGSDLMNLKFLIVLTMVLCAFCVFPVNADVYLGFNPYNQIFDLGENPEDKTISFNYGIFSQSIGYYSPNSVDYYATNDGNVTGDIYYSDSNNLADCPLLKLNLLPYQVGFNKFDIFGKTSEQSTYSYRFSVQYNVTSTKDIIVEKDENIINLGDISNLNQMFSIGSMQNGNIILYHSYSGVNCTITDLGTTYVNVRLDENFNIARINLIGDIEYNDIPDSFNTDAIIYYNYNSTKPILPTNEIQGFIQTFDYQNGNMLTGVNLSVFEVIENNGNLQIGNKIYSSINADSQTILTVKNNTEYFVKNEKTGYFSVKNTVYDSLNGETGYLWNPSLMNPLRLYYSRLDASAQYNANFIVQDVNNNGLSGVSVTMDNAVTKITNSIGGLTFNNISAGTHTFVFVKNGYQTVQQTIDIQLQYAAFYQTMYKENQIVQPTVSPSVYPTVQPTAQPTISPIDQPTNLGESIKYGLAKMFGVNSLNTINLIFALLIILFPAVVGAVVTNQALGFISGGLIGFVFALGIGLIPIWVFFSMIMLSVIYLVMTHTEAGF